MNRLPTEHNGDGVTETQPVAVVSIEERVIYLENRVAVLEAEQKRFMESLQFAGKFIFNNPASKMITMSLPKEVQQKLKDYFRG